MWPSKTGCTGGYSRAAATSESSSAGEPVDAARVLLALVLEQRVRSADPELLGRPGVLVRAQPLVAHERNAVTARIGHPLHVDHDDRPPRLGAVGLGEGTALEQLVEAGVAGGHHLTASVQPEDPRRPLEGAQHDHDAPVLAQVGDRLRAAADHVEVGDGALVEHPQGVDRPLRRDVHVTLAVERRRADEEQRLALDPAAQVIVDAVEDLAHSGNCT